jgi:DAK2 domain fusion protein YloV
VIDGAPGRPDPPNDATRQRRRHCDGPTLLVAFRAAVANLESNVELVNALNVFPVPDGDTGSNMLATVRAALEEAERIPVGQRRLHRVADALSHGALMGARGNSGLILSQVLRGMAEVARDKHRADGLDLGRALRRGAELAYAAVGQPVEGTILTVAREAADAAAVAGASERHIETVLETAVDGAERSVARTPSLLPALREAGVVDSGGHGLFLLLRGMLLDLADREDAPGPVYAIPDLAALRRLPEHADHSEHGYGYETMFVVRAGAGAPALDLAGMRAALQGLGESVMVAGDDHIANVHVHNAEPDRILRYALTLGSLSQVTVENLDDQAAARAGDTQARNNGSRPDGAQSPGAKGGGILSGTTALVERSSGGRESVPAPAEVGAPTSGVAVVAVAPGEGLERTFKSLGAAAVVRGGATANPSVGELLDGIGATGAQHVVLLPNHRNVVLVARQAAELSGKDVLVLETRNAAEGIAAMLAFDARRSLEANAEGMRGAAGAVQTLEVTRAVRDARIAGRAIRQGETLVLGPDENVITAGDDRLDAVIEAVAQLKPAFELLTAYVGIGVGQIEPEELRQRVGERFPGVQVEIVDGGQPYYAYLISAE